MAKMTPQGDCYLWMIVGNQRYYMSETLIDSLLFKSIEATITLMSPTDSGIRRLVNLPDVFDLEIHRPLGQSDVYHEDDILIKLNRCKVEEIWFKHVIEMSSEPLAVFTLLSHSESMNAMWYGAENEVLEWEENYERIN